MKKYAFLTLALFIAASNGALAGVHIVGGGTPDSYNTFPFAGNRPGMRWQTMWFQGELNEAGGVSLIEWQIYSIAGQGGVFIDCDILLCNTTITTLTNTFASNYGTATPVNVFKGTYNLQAYPANTWVKIVSPTNFRYNNTGNLLMEVSWSSATGGTNPFKVRQTGGNRPGRVYNTASGAKTATTGTLDTYYHHYGRITIGYEGVNPTSLGRVKSLFH